MPTTPTRNLTSDNGVSFYTRPGLPSSPAPSLQGRPLTANSSSLSPHTTTPTRSPLAPLPPQLFTMPPESQHRSPAGGPSASSYGRNEEPGGRSNGSKISAKLAGNIIDRPMFDVEEVPKSPGLQPPRRKGAASQSPASSSSRGPQYTRPTSRRNSRTSTNSTSSRRTSLPALHLLTPSTAATQLGAMSSGTLPTPTEDLYSNLSAFTFGTANTQPYDADTEMVGPLQSTTGSFVRRPSTDQTPRPSFSGASASSRRRVPEADEEPDDAAFVRRMSRGKIRALDIGARRPSLPTNMADPTSDPSSDPTSSASDFEHEYTASDGGLDTDVELEVDVQRPTQQVQPSPHPRTYSRRNPESDAASVNTFGGGSDRYSRRSSYSRREVSSEDDDAVKELGIPLRSMPANVPRVPIVPILRHEPQQSLPPDHYTHGWDIPEVAVQGPGPEAPPLPGPSRQQQGSFGTLRRSSQIHIEQPSRSSDESSNAVTFVGSSSPTEPAAAVYDGFDLDFIYDASGQRRPSAVSFDPRASDQTVRGGRSTTLGSFSFLSQGVRRGSTATTHSGGSEDAFMKHLRAQDPLYKQRIAEWSFRKEKADGQRDLTRIASTATHVNDARGKPIQIGLQEIWRCEYVGRFKVDRVMWPPEEPGRPQQQRLNTRNFPDPYSKGYQQGGPAGLIHKHTRAVAFSIFREHDLQTVRRNGSSHMSMGMGVLLAPRRVQEQYTSTRTTSKLNDHGLLQDRPGRASTSSSMRPRSVSRSARKGPSSSEKDKKDKKDKDKKGKERARQESPQIADSEPAVQTKSRTFSLSSQSRGSSAPVESRPSPPPMPSSARPSPSPSVSASTLASGHTRSPSPEPVSRSSSQATSFDMQSTRSIAPPSSSIRSSSESPLFTVGAGPSYLPRQREDSMDLEDEEPQQRMRSHKEAFGTLDVDVLEQLHRGQTQDGGLSVIKRKWFGGKSRGASSQGTPIMAPYEARWLTLASRQDVEQQERTIARLNNSFKDVGLLPTMDPKKNRKAKGRIGAGGNSRRPDEDVFKPVPDDALFMLLPLWPKESDIKSDNDASCEPPLEERQFLLVYYRREEGKKKPKKRVPPNTPGSTSPGHGHQEMAEDPSQLRTFHVCARVLGYDQLRRSGVRCPSHGLAVTGTMRDAFNSIPPPEVREREYDPVVIALWHSRETGLELVTEPLDKLGLCQERTPDLDPDDAPPLTPIGRAAAEMAWLGAMALTSFGPV